MSKFVKEWIGSNIDFDEVLTQEEVNDLFHIMDNLFYQEETKKKINK